MARCVAPGGRVVFAERRRSAWRRCSPRLGFSRSRRRAVASVGVADKPDDAPDEARGSVVIGREPRQPAGEEQARQEGRLTRIVCKLPNHRRIKRGGARSMCVRESSVRAGRPARGGSSSCAPLRQFMHPAPPPRRRPPRRCTTSAPAASSATASSGQFAARISCLRRGAARAAGATYSKYGRATSVQPGRAAGGGGHGDGGMG